MDILRDTLRKRRWTPRPPPNWDSALAHKKQCNDVFLVANQDNKKKIVHGNHKRCASVECNQTTHMLWHLLSLFKYCKLLNVCDI